MILTTMPDITNFDYWVRKPIVEQRGDMPQYRCDYCGVLSFHTYFHHDERTGKDQNLCESCSFDSDVTGGTDV